MKPTTTLLTGLLLSVAALGRPAWGQALAGLGAAGQAGVVKAAQVGNALEINCLYLKSLGPLDRREAEIDNRLGRGLTALAVKDFIHGLDGLPSGLEACSIRLDPDSQGDYDLRLESKAAGAQRPVRLFGRHEPAWSGARGGDGLALYAQDDSGAWTRAFQYFDGWEYFRERVSVGRKVAVNRGNGRWADAVEETIQRERREADGNWKPHGQAVVRLRTVAEPRDIPRVPWENRSPDPAPLCGASVDLSAQILGPSRFQGSVGSCHAFGAVGALEAAFNRHYAAKLGRLSRFSEWDVFARNKWDGIQKASIMGWFEGGLPSSDLEFAIEHGIVTEELAPYGRYASQYLSRGGSVGDYSDRERLAKKLGVPRETIERIEDARAAFREAFKGFAVQKRVPAGDLTGVRMRNAVVESLCGGKLAVVCMDIGGLAEWGTETGCFFKPACLHCFAVYGYRQTDRGLEFLTRNSWGQAYGTYTANPPIRSEQFSRLFHAAWVEGPQDRGEPFAPSEDLLGRLRALAGAPDSAGHKEGGSR